MRRPPGFWKDTGRRFWSWRNKQVTFKRSPSHIVDKKSDIMCTSHDVAFILVILGEEMDHVHKNPWLGFDHRGHEPQLQLSG